METNKIYIYSSSLLPYVTIEDVDKKQLFLSIEDSYLVEIINSFNSQMPLGIYIFANRQIRVKKKFTTLLTYYMPICIFIYEPIQEIKPNLSEPIIEHEIFEKPLQYLFVKCSLPVKQNYEQDVQILKKIAHGVTIDKLSNTYHCLCLYEIGKLTQLFHSTDIENILFHISTQIVNAYQCTPIFLSIKQYTCYFSN